MSRGGCSLIAFDSPQSHHTKLQVPQTISTQFTVKAWGGPPRLLPPHISISLTKTTSMNE